MILKLTFKKIPILQEWNLITESSPNKQNIIYIESLASLLSA